MAFVSDPWPIVMPSLVLFDVPVNEEAGHCVAAPAATSQSGVESLQPKPVHRSQNAGTSG